MYFLSAFYLRSYIASHFILHGIALNFLLHFECILERIGIVEKLLVIHLDFPGLEILEYKHKRYPHPDRHDHCKP